MKPKKQKNPAMVASLFALAASAVFFTVIPVRLPAARAAIGSSPGYNLDASTLVNSEGSGASANYGLPEFTLGNKFDGSASSASYKLCSEFVEETEGTCIAVVPVPPTPPPVPPTPPPPASGGGGGGSGYAPPRELVIKPPVTPVVPIKKPTEPLKPSVPVVQPGEQPVSKPGEEPAVEVQQPGTEVASPSLPGAPGGRPEETAGGGPPAVVALMPSIQGIGEVGYKEIPFFKMPEAIENVWCGKSSCEGTPVQLLKPAAPVTRKLIPVSWERWFLLSLVITVLLYWVAWKIETGKPLPVHTRRHPRAAVRRRKKRK